MKFARPTLLSLVFLLFFFMPSSGQSGGTQWGHVDIGVLRNSNSAQEGLNIHDASAGTYTNIQLVEKAWSGSHSILFNAYKSANANQLNGPLTHLGNTKYANNAGSSSGGAGMIEFRANYGRMSFYVSPQSTGQNDDVIWPTPQLTIWRDGQVGIGTESQSHKLSVNGNIRAKEIIVDTGWSDFVFDDDYDLPTLGEVADHIDTHGHLPDVPSAAEVASDGVSLGEMDATLLQKIEELTLYTIAQEEQIESLLQAMAAQQAQIEDLQASLHTLESK